MASRWRKVAQDLARLAEDQRGKPEGELARQISAGEHDTKGEVSLG